MPQILELPDNLSFIIIDESESFRDSLAMGLKSLGFKNVYQASSSLIAFENLKAKKIDFIICELNMTDINGIEFLKEIRDANDIANTPFLMISNEATKADIAMLAEYEIDGYLKKPFTFQALAQKIPSCMSHYNDPFSKEHVFQEAKSFYKKGDYEAAINVFEALLKKIPESSRARVGLASCFRAMKNFAKAENFCMQAIEKIHYMCNLLMKWAEYIWK